MKKNVLSMAVACVLSGVMLTVAVDEVVKVMNIAKDNNYKLILATSPK
jgi:ABC-type branched-subunit amino acid transport system substrate-binding protein